jgi:electron transport complex protein RnfB
LVDQLLGALPQTQCTRCGYPDCASYAQAIASEGAAINQCPPGGAEGIARLAAITGLPALALNLVHGVETTRSVVFIDENWCIGCTLCIAACPTDAIIGTHKAMHTVQEAHCTGCELCLPVCPVDCIVLENASGQSTGWAAWSTAQALNAQERYRFKSKRLNVDKGVSTLPVPESIASPSSKQALIAAAMTRARERSQRSSAP